ncbi:MAG: hypothetical protein JW704_13230 [Anaerolineaceae bacterium]|nr:hypothetical protein [Anaerolineaceae bacterium]
MSDSDKKIWKNYYKALEGCLIQNVKGDAEFPSFDAVRPDGKTFHIEVSRDPEGNGPGFLFGLESEFMAPVCPGFVVDNQGICHHCGRTEQEH